MQTIGDRPRDVCSVCGTVFYQNPLPAAGALVLDDQRRVLLVKRKYPPGEGMWCLPIGFAEIGETIAEAALRELHEETGVTGRVMRLIDADSSHGEFYGDVLVVTFEVEKLLGMERPGDDAAEVDYFPIDRLPPLAFPHNEKAIRLCADLHRDEWAIHDSFRHLEEDGAGAAGGDAEDEAARETAERRQRRCSPTASSASSTRASRWWQVCGWPTSARITPRRPTCASIPTRCWRSAPPVSGSWAAGSRARAPRSRSGSPSTTSAPAARHKGVPLHELLSAIMLLKRQIWAHARSQGVWQRPMEMYRVMELQSRFAVFFDRAMYHSARGYTGG